MFGLFFLINIGHLFQTAALTASSIFVALLLLGTSLLVIWGTAYLLTGVDWQQSVTVFDTAWIGNVFSFTTLQ
jgi:hypothetical protein